MLYQFVIVKRVRNAHRFAGKLHSFKMFFGFKYFNAIVVL